MKYRNTFYVKDGQDRFPHEFLWKAYKAVSIYNEVVNENGTPNERVTLADQGAHLIVTRDSDDKDIFVIFLDYPLKDDDGRISEYFETDS